MEARFLSKRPLAIASKIPGIACMLLMAQVYLVAPLHPILVNEFNSTLVNLAIPAFALPFAIVAPVLVYFRPSINLDKWFLFSLASLCIGTFLLSMVNSAPAFLLVRTLTGLGTGMMLTTALLLAAESTTEKNALANIIIIIFSLAAGMTFGPSLGGWLHGIFGWRMLYQITGALAGLLCFLYWLYGLRGPLTIRQPQQMIVLSTAQSFWKNWNAYTFAYLTGVYHSGVFVWISYYFTTRYGLDEYAIATDLFIFGFPGLVIAILMHQYNLDTKVVRILYSGLIIVTAGLLLLTVHMPLWLAECLLGAMSVGFSCTQPLFIGVLSLKGTPAAEPIAKGSGLLFAGYGTGPLMMIALLNIDRNLSMAFLGLLVIVLALFSRHIWIEPKLENRHKRPSLQE